MTASATFRTQGSPSSQPQPTPAKGFRENTPETALLARIAARREHHPRRVLVVDDSPATVEVLGLLVARMGYEVETALDGVEALERVESFAPGVVLMDLSMPRMDGFEAAERLFERYGNDTPILVAVSGWTLPEDRERAFRAGFDLHLEKPISSVALRALMEQMAGNEADSAGK